MAIDLPETVAAYFEADKELSAEAVAAIFLPTAAVKDEGRTYSGRDEILRWKKESSSKYSYTVEPYAIGEEEGRTVVTSHLTGDFPGSPVDLRYLFALGGDKIAELEIKA